jgi:hypothetical protein
MAMLRLTLMAAVLASCTHAGSGDSDKSCYAKISSCSVNVYGSDLQLPINESAFRDFLSQEGFEYVEVGGETGETTPLVSDTVYVNDVSDPTGYIVYKIPSQSWTYRSYLFLRDDADNIVYFQIFESALNPY